MKKNKFLFMLFIIILNLFNTFAIAEDQKFVKEFYQLPLIKVPLNHNDVLALYRDDLLKIIPIHLKNFLNIPADIEDILSARLPQISLNINPLLINVLKDSGETDSFLYILSNDYKVLDKLLVYSYRTTTRGGPGGYGQPVGYRYFTIDKNYFIERRQRFENETIEVQHHQVTKEGKFQELPVTSNCYSEFAIKDKKIHSTKSLLLTSHQANDYLRFNDGDLYDLNDVTMTLKPNEKQFCINYQQSYPVTLGKIDAKQFFGDETFYQQQVKNFKKYNIDISKELDYITFDNIENTPLAKFLWNNNQAIYMKDTLFIVGKNYFVSYRQPTPEEITYSEYK